MKKKKTLLIINSNLAILLIALICFLRTRIEFLSRDLIQSPL